jgi:hypothetical protein
VRYELASESYRVNYEESNQVRVHRDVTFNEGALSENLKTSHPPHIIREGELEHFDKLSELPQRAPVPKGQSRLDMFSSSDEDETEIETDYPPPPIPDNDEPNYNPDQKFSMQEPGGDLSNANTSEFTPSHDSYSGSESNPLSPTNSPPPAPAPAPAPNRQANNAPTTRTNRLPRGQGARVLSTT